jgi:nucleotide-binding universal stress UspA family protein
MAASDVQGCQPTKARAMYHQILIPVDLADPALAKPALDTGVTLAKAYSGAIRLINVLPMTPVMLAEYVPPDFDVQQRKSAEDALAQIAKEVGIEGRISTIVRQGGIYHEILEEAKAIKADLILMSSHRPGGMRTYLIGSNASHVVRYATCSVLVVRK